MERIHGLEQGAAATAKACDLVFRALIVTRAYNSSTPRSSANASPILTCGTTRQTYNAILGLTIYESGWCPTPARLFSPRWQIVSSQDIPRIYLSIG